MVGELTAGTDFDTDDDNSNVHLTEAGARKLEARLGGIDLYSEEHVATTLTEVNVALHAHVLLQRDVHYIVRDNAVHLINASRGRIASLQRWPDGLQAAVEAKEGIDTTETGEVLDTITVQALVNRYPTVCGMTGTALAAGEQLRQFYKLGVSPIPPNTPNIREDETDRVYITLAAKNDAIVEHIAEVHETGQPVLVGTHDVAESEELHEKLVKAGVPAVVLNAKNDAEEAAVIAEAGAAMRTDPVKRMIGGLLGRRLMIGVDRLDYSKGLVERFSAYQRFLERNAELRRKLIYLQIAPLSRDDIQAYAAIREALEQATGRTNGRFADTDWTPLRYLNKNFPHGTLMGFMRAAQVGIVTPLRDGMNLVAKEFVAAQDPADPGALILSSLAGAARERDGAVIVNPYDLRGVAQAIETSLAMPLAERQARHSAMLATLRGNDLKAWYTNFLAALSAGV